MLFEQVDAALHGVALLVCALVERRRPAALGSQSAPVASMVLPGRDDTPDPASTQPRRLAFELYALSASTRSGRVRGRPTLAALLTAQVQLRGPATPGTPQRVIDRLDTANTAGRLGLQIPPFSAPQRRASTVPAHPATVHRPAPATESHHSAAACSTSAGDPASCLWAATVPAPLTARRSGPPARSPVSCPRGLRGIGLLGRRTIYRRPRHLSIDHRHAGRQVGALTSETRPRSTPGADLPGSSVCGAGLSPCCSKSIRMTTRRAVGRLTSSNPASSKT